MNGSENLCILQENSFHQMIGFNDSNESLMTISIHDSESSPHQKYSQSCSPQPIHISRSSQKTSHSRYSSYKEEDSKLHPTTPVSQRVVKSRYEMRSDLKDVGIQTNVKLKTRKSILCTKCGKSYSKNQYVRDHMLTVHCKSEVNYSCRVCGQSCGWRVTLLKHIKRCHPEKNTSEMIDILY